ncbi:unnamed protein product, partial [Didymodactylos carnosus]
VLVFPPFDSYHRLLIHRARDQNSNLFSISVGGKGSRRTLVCFIELAAKMADATSSTFIDQSTMNNTTLDDITSQNKNRRPDQVLYKPRSQTTKNGVNGDSCEAKTTTEETTNDNVTVPSPSATTVASKKCSSSKPKLKGARPSLETYIPPSRRRSTKKEETSVSAEDKPQILATTTTTTTTTAIDNIDSALSNIKLSDDASSDDSASWDKLFDDNGNAINEDEFLGKLRTTFKEEDISVKKVANDYSKWSLEDIQINEAELCHVVEAYDFPSQFRTEDLAAAFRTLTRTTFDIKWVDDTHALVVFPDASSTLDALQMQHALMKIRPMSQASVASRKKAKTSSGTNIFVK